MNPDSRRRALQEIDRRGLIKRTINLSHLMCFNHRRARLAALLPPGATATFAGKLTSAELREWIKT